MENWQIVSKQKIQSLKKNNGLSTLFSVVSQQRLIYETFKEKFHLEFSRAITLIPNARKKVIIDKKFKTALSWSTLINKNNQNHLTHNNHHSNAVFMHRMLCLPYVQLFWTSLYRSLVFLYNLVFFPRNIDNHCKNYRSSIILKQYRA